LSAPPNLIAAIRGPTSKGRGGKGREEREGREREGKEDPMNGRWLRACNYRTY